MLHKIELLEELSAASEGLENGEWFVPTLCKITNQIGSRFIAYRKSDIILITKLERVIKTEVLI